jgi:hypothetical protein
MNNHTQTAQNTNLGSSTTHTEVDQEAIRKKEAAAKRKAQRDAKKEKEAEIPKESLSKQDQLHEFESKVGQALIGGVAEIKTSKNIIDHFIVSAPNKAAFEDQGYFIYKGIRVTDQG